MAVTQAYNIQLGRTRMQSHLATRPGTLQRVAALQHIGEVDKTIHRLTRTVLARSDLITHVE